MKALLAGGPCEGVVDTRGRETASGICWTLSINHVNCGCAWCKEIGVSAVEHLYERDDEDVFRYRLSRPCPVELGRSPWRHFGAE